MTGGWSVRDAVTWTVLLEDEEAVCRNALATFQRSGMHPILVYTAPFSGAPNKPDGGMAKAA